MKLYSKILERNWIFPALTSREQEEVVDKVAELSKEAETTELTDEMMTDALGHLYDPYYLRSLNSEENGEKAMDANLRKDEPDYKNSKIKTTTTEEPYSIEGFNQKFKRITIHTTTTTLVPVYSDSDTSEPNSPIDNSNAENNDVMMDVDDPATNATTTTLTASQQVAHIQRHEKAADKKVVNCKRAYHLNASHNIENRRVEQQQQDLAAITKIQKKENKQRTTALNYYQTSFKSYHFIGKGSGKTCRHENTPTDGKCKEKWTKTLHDIQAPNPLWGSCEGCSVIWCPKHRECATSKNHLKLCKKRKIVISYIDSFTEAELLCQEIQTTNQQANSTSGTSSAAPMSIE